MLKQHKDIQFSKQLFFQLPWRNGISLVWRRNNYTVIIDQSRYKLIHKLATWSIKTIGLKARSASTRIQQPFFSFRWQNKFKLVPRRNTIT